MTQSWFFTPALLGVKESWRLARWCVEQGADEFTVRVLCAEGQGTRADLFEDTFEARVVTTDLRHVVATLEDEPARQVRLWRLDEDALQALRTFLPDGLFTHRVDPHGWLEDPMFFRDGQLMLGVVTHQREGVVRVTPVELRELERIGFDFAREATAIRF
ncbi:MAG TPA: hypothetical protein VF034_06595 [Gemmatimonadaceae bacterium]|jgi:hypothetical protein